MPNLDPAALHLDLNLADPSVRFGVGRCVADQVVRRQVVDDAPDTFVKVVGIHDRDAVGIGGELVQPIEPAVGVHAQSPRIDRIETRVRSIGIVEEIAEFLLVVGLRNTHALGIAL